MKIRVTYVISNIEKALSFEWTSELLDKQKIDLSFILLNPANSQLETYLKSNGFPVKRIKYKNKFDIFKAIALCTVFISRQKPGVIHTHLFDANIAGLLAGWLCRVKTRIYTRHHSSYHHDYFPKAVKYDKLCNRLATKIIAPAKIVKEILVNREFVPEEKVVVIHHGFKLNNFFNVSEQDITALKKKYDITKANPVIGVISRYTEWKGIQYIIPAFKRLLKEYPNARLVLANATGDYAAEIKNMLKEIPEKNYTEITFENNLYALYRLFNVFVHVPIDKYSEAFGQIYVEASASSVPSVFTLSGIASDFIKNGQNALVVNYKDSDGIHHAIKEIIENKLLAASLTEKGKADVRALFPVSKMIADLESLYLGSLNGE